jgi:hypothetical protein
VPSYKFLIVILAFWLLKFFQTIVDRTDSCNALLTLRDQRGLPSFVLTFSNVTLRLLCWPHQCLLYPPHSLISSERLPPSGKSSLALCFFLCLSHCELLYVFSDFKHLYCEAKTANLMWFLKLFFSFLKIKMFIYLTVVEVEYSRLGGPMWLAPYEGLFPAS